MNNSVVLSLVVLSVGIALAVASAQISWRAKMRSNNNGGIPPSVQALMLNLQKQLTTCQEERQQQQLDLVQVRQALDLHSSRLLEQEAEIEGLRRALITMAENQSRSVARRRADDAERKEKRLATIRAELATAKNNLASWQFEETRDGANVFRQNQMAGARARIKEIEGELDEETE